jgi:hypothetical protein
MLWWKLRINTVPQADARERADQGRASMAITAVAFLPPFPNPVPKRRCYDAQGNLLRQDRNKT